MVSETESLSRNERKLLLLLDASGGRITPEKAIESGEFSLDVEVMGAASWLSSKGMAEIKETQTRFVVLSEGVPKDVRLPERKAIEAIDSAGGSMPMPKLADAMPGGEDKIAIGWLKRKKLADMVKGADGTDIVLTDVGKAALGKEMPEEALLKKLAGGPVKEGDADPEAVKGLRGRQKMIADLVEVRREIKITKLGRKAVESGIAVGEEVTQVTDELIQTGKWRDVEFRKYDVRAFAPTAHPAKKNPLSRLALEVRTLFAEMGFQEVDGEYVVPAFWNLDVLFIPQDHPARELQDTFYLEEPASIPVDDDALVEAVREIHETGGDTGSTGWGGEWSREVAERALLRTHTTINTIRYLHKHPEPPAKVFSLSRIFRKEAMDSTHLPEFTQIEGFILDENASFDMLVGLIKEFYSKMGFDTIRVRPAYFPYTEPSLEVEVFFNGKWMELGGAGVIRPEVLAPMGVGHPVIAWGFGFERLAMLKWDVADIRDLYVSDVEYLRNTPLF
ncbi:MAG: phenylalanine--tRNA ligase subunit alpha [Thermoplasmatales archaeon]|nr:phenylalanine--tRNA ligase subunit alpha [Thermoplasmatales archaeon]